MTEALVSVPAENDVSHRDIIDAGGGPAAVARTISEVEESAGRPAVEANTVKAWKRTDSIPSPYWRAFADAQLATLEQLAAAAAAKRAA